MTAQKLRWHGQALVVGRVPEGTRIPGKPDGAGRNAGPIRAELTTSAGRTVVFPHRLVDELGPDARIEGPFRALEVAGPLEFSLTGVLTSLLTPLAEAGISVFTLSTFDTDWILIPAETVDPATRALTAAGHTVMTEEQQ